jgi:tetratricopeptide (TPR) repeat protein
VELGELDAAMRDVEEGIRRGQPAHHLRALIHMRAGRAMQALADFERAITHDPIQPDLFAKRGQLRRSIGDWAGAVADFSEALRLNPEEPMYYLSRAENLFAQGHAVRAFADLDAAIQMDPRPSFFYVRGDLLRRQGRYDEAVTELTRAIDGNPDFKPAYVARALCHVQKGRAGHARTDLLRFQQLGGQLDEGMREFLARSAP